jgi:hypothetical protein
MSAIFSAVNTLSEDSPLLPLLDGVFGDIELVYGRSSPDLPINIALVRLGEVDYYYVFDISIISMRGSNIAVKLRTSSDFKKFCEDSFIICVEAIDKKYRKYYSEIPPTYNLNPLHQLLVNYDISKCKEYYPWKGFSINIFRVNKKKRNSKLEIRFNDELIYELPESEYAPKA